MKKYIFLISFYLCAILAHSQSLMNKDVEYTTGTELSSQQDEFVSKTEASTKHQVNTKSTSDNNILLSINSLTGLDYIQGYGPSSQKSFVISASGLTNGVIVTVPINYEISVFSGTEFNGTDIMSIVHTDGNIDAITIYIRLKKGLTANNYNEELTVSSAGSTTQTISLSGTVTPAIIEVSTTELSNFIYTMGGGPSAQKSFTLSGSGLTSEIIVTAPTNYEISVLSGTSFNGTNTLSISQTNGNISSTTIYVRLKSGLSTNAYTGNIILSSPYANSRSIALSGSVTNPKGILISTTTITGFNYTENAGPSAQKSFQVKGVELSSFMAIIAPSNYEISTTSGVSFSGSSQIILPHSSGSINEITVYIRLKKNLIPDIYVGSLSASTTGYPTKYISLSGNVNKTWTSPSTQPTVDPAVYAPMGVNGKMTLTSKWLYSNATKNYNVAEDFVAPATTARGMAVKDGKMLFVDRANKQLTVVNGKTGAREAPIALDQTMFTYQGRNIADTADSTYIAGLWGFQDVKVDNAGNVLLSNIITSSTGRFQVWNVDITTGAGTLVVDQPNLADLFPTATIRFDAFGVWGDVNGSAVIMAANATAMEVYKWEITGGVAAAPVLIVLDNQTEGTLLSGLANPGNAPQVFPLDDNYFYLDGNATYPTLMDRDGNVIDGFYNNMSALQDSATAPVADPKTIWKMNTGHNGIEEFEVDGKYFILMAATNTAGVPASTYRLFQFADAGKSFADMKCLWTFPQAGMGVQSNVYRTAIPSVEVSGSKAMLYLYAGENGYGMYELETNQTWTETSLKQSTEIKIYFANNEIHISEEVAKVEVYSITGQKVASATNISTLKSPTMKGIYIVSIVNNNGFKKTEKIVVR